MSDEMHTHRWSSDLSGTNLGGFTRQHEFPPILGLLGPMGAGKTTLANAVVARVGGVRMSFAQPIRDMLIALGVEADALAHRKSEPIGWLYDQTPRQLLRSLGTAWGRDLVCRDLWVRAVLRAARAQQRPVVVDDVRFDNEARLLSDAGACLAYINHPTVRLTYEHPTEWGLRDWAPLDLVINMDGNAVVSDPSVYDPHPLGAGTVAPAWLAGELNPGVPRQPWWIRTSLVPLSVKLRVARQLTRRRSRGFKTTAALTPPDYAARRLCERWSELNRAR